MSSSDTRATGSSRSTPTPTTSSSPPTRADRSTEVRRPAAFDIGRDTGSDRAQRRIAHSQAKLRRLNEAMRAPAGGDMAFRCECGQLGCNQLIALSHDDYESVRAHTRRFAIVPGHEVSEIDAPVERHERYVVVEARAPAAAGRGRPDRPADGPQLTEAGDRRGVRYACVG